MTQRRSRFFPILPVVAAMAMSVAAAVDAPTATDPSAGSTRVGNGTANDGAVVPMVRVQVTYPDRDRSTSANSGAVGGGVTNGGGGSASSISSGTGTDADALVTIDEFPALYPDGPVVSEALVDSSPADTVVLATLAGDAITMQDLVDEVLKTRGSETFHWLVGRELLRRELTRHRLQVRDWEVEDQLQKHIIGLRKAFPHLTRPDDLTRAAAGMPLDEYRDRTVWSELALRKILRVVAKPSDDDLRRFYADIRADFIRPERVRISQVFIPPPVDPNGDGIPTPDDWRQAERLILEAYNQIRMGKDFADVLRAYGVGGQMSRWVGRGELLRELEEPAFSIAPGSITTPIKSAMGYHTLMVEEREDRKEPPFEEVRGEVLARFEEEQFVRKAGEFMDLLKSQALESGELVIEDSSAIFSGESPNGQTKN